MIGFIICTRIHVTLNFTNKTTHSTGIDPPPVGRGGAARGWRCTKSDGWSAVDVVRGPLVTFSGIEKVDNIMQVLKSCKHNGFPVIDEPPFPEAPILYGLVLRSHLLVLLKKKLFLPLRDLASEDFVEQFSSVDFAKPGSGKGLNIEAIEISADEAEMFIDLHPFANTSPYTVVETMSLAKAQILFRQVGLRHLCVVPKSSRRPPIVGILTRHDFMPEYILEMYPDLKQNRWKRLRIRLSAFTGIMKTLPIITEGIKKLLNIVVDPSTIAQAAIPQIIKKTPEDFYQQTLQLLSHAADICYDRIQKLDVFYCPAKPEGSMFVMVKINISGLVDIRDDIEFSAMLAKEESVIVLPGSPLGLKNWIRVTFAISPSVLEEGFDRIAAFCMRHAKNT